MPESGEVITEVFLGHPFSPELHYKLMVRVLETGDEFGDQKLVNGMEVAREEARPQDLV